MDGVSTQKAPAAEIKEKASTPGLFHCQSPSEPITGQWSLLIDIAWQKHQSQVFDKQDN